MKAASETLNIKSGLYLKPVKAGLIQINGINFRIPESFLTLVRVEGNEAYIADKSGDVLCKLKRVTE